MSQAEYVHQLLEQLGPSTPEVTNVTQIAEDVWAVGYDEQSILILQLDDEGSTLVVSCAVGHPEESARQTVFESLLTYNSQWRQTGGVTMAMADGEALQLFSTEAASLDLERLRNMLANFVDKARIWRRYVETAGSLPRGAGELAGLRV